MQSDDIRSQLPEESKRFECADGEWRDMMYGAQAQPNVVEACQHEGREDLLVKLRDSIETCEKALGGTAEIGLASIYPSSPHHKATSFGSCLEGA